MQALYRIQESYDICIIDTRPAFESIAHAVILTADVLLTPVYLDNFCRDNLALVEDYLDSLPETYAPEWKIMAVKVDASRRAQKEIYTDLMDKHSYPFLNTCISSSAAADNALSLYKPLKKHRSKSQIAEDYADLAEELLGLEG